MNTSFTRGENPLRADKLNSAFAERVSRAGDTMQGMLRLAADPVTALPTGTATRSTFDTTSVTLPQLAQRVKALIDDLSAYGLIGA